MKKIKITEKQGIIISNLAFKKQQLESQFHDAETNLNTAISLIADFNGIEKYERVEINDNELIFN